MTLRALPAYWFNQTGKTQRLTTTFDSGGGPINSYADYLTGVPMRVNIPSGSQDAQRERINGVLVTKIFINGNPAPDIIDTDRIVLSGNVYDVKAVRDVDLLGVFLTIDAVEVQPSAEVD